MATSPPEVCAQLQAALQTMATGDLQTSATHLLATLGYARPKTLALPSAPQAFPKEIEALLGGSKQLNADQASLADWQSAAFLFQLTDDELTALAAGQMSLLAPAWPPSRARSPERAKHSPSGNRGGGGCGGHVS